MTQELPRSATTVPLHLTVDPYWDSLTVITFGRVDDGLPPAQCPVLGEDERIGFLLDGPGAGPVIGFRVAEPHAVDVLALESDEIWSGPRFGVPALGLVGVSVGEILLAVQGRFREDEPTADALHFHAAIAAGGEDPGDVIEVEGSFRLALEAGDMKALFGLGYTLVEAGRPREAYDALRRYTELTPSNAWAWFWLGRACVDMGAAGEARSAFERALACEQEGSFETDAREYLEELSS
ncbi:MAG: tetratricopeptide repeat protein [Solirubrobacteraceae bacterium MAG38_C4-C5]|nr:tetratricopeptide repeat protein [Candidatus Siliceabacter maunaloa]